MGKSKILVDEDEQRKERRKNNILDMWDLIEEDYDKLEELEEMYGDKIKKKHADPFDDSLIVMNILDRRNKMSFLERTAELKRRISFFGVFVIGEDLQLIMT